MQPVRTIIHPPLKSNAPNVYVVKRGDTLWDISGHFLNKPWHWPEIWASNQHVKIHTGSIRVTDYYYVA